jgi:uncharacterized RDD family membrane protein YckC
MTDADTTNAAGRGRRLLATIIDLILVFCFGLLLMLVTGALEDAEDFAGEYFLLRIPLLGICSYLLLNTLPLWRSGQTLGKLMLGLKITAADGTSKAPLWKLLGLRALFFLAIYATPSPVGLLVLIDHLFIFRGKQRCLHDLIAGTTVIKTT